MKAATPTSAAFLTMSPIIPSHDLFESSLPQLDCEMVYKVLKNIRDI
jgi:hypothetical protein